MRCYLCPTTEKQRHGACIQCDYKQCMRSFHVRCGIEKGCIDNWAAMDKRKKRESSHKIPIYCVEHTRKVFGLAALRPNSSSGTSDVIMTGDWAGESAVPPGNKKRVVKATKKQ